MEIAVCCLKIQSMNKVIIITGEKGQGKTTAITMFLDSLSNTNTLAGGIYARGFWENNARKGYNVVDILDGNERPLCDVSPSHGDLAFGHFFFKASGISFGRKAIRKSLEQNINILIIDEVGGLELSGKGWAIELDHIFEYKRNFLMLLVVRKSLLNDVFNRWAINDPVIIDINKFEISEIQSIILSQIDAFKSDR
jgi:nucleoside-triphosphatase